MIQVMIAAPRSGSGKTTVTCALLRALQRRGYQVCAFKVGPDYIDPTFHRAVLGVESRNLDLFLSDGDCVRDLYAESCAGHDAAVVEGVMGYYDGLGGTSDRASSFRVADTLGIPVLLVLRARGASLTLAAELKGLRAFRERSGIAGVLLNECPPKLYPLLRDMLERETGVPVLGYLPPLEHGLESRHLGLCTAVEADELNERINDYSEKLSAQMDWRHFGQIFDRKKPEEAREKATKKPKKVRIAIAADKALFFTYQETLDLLQKLGVVIVPFSPLTDVELPENIGGLYLPGGYPELYAETLSANQKMIQSIRGAVLKGIPTVAECGGFLYLGESLCDEQGKSFPMVGVLPGRAENAGRAVRFGYQTLCAETDSLLFRAGERIPAHEFHYWESTACGDALRVEKGDRSWRSGFVSDTLYAAFPHLYFAGHPVFAERFVEAARRYAETHGAS